MARLRSARPSDATALAALLAEEVRSGVAHFGTSAPTEAEVARDIAESYPFLVAEQDGEVLGLARASPYKARGAYRWTAEIGVYLAPGHQGRGHGRRLVTALIEALEQRGYRTLLAGIALPNPASVALFEGLGFRHAGTLPAVGYKHGAWRDVGYWHRHLGQGPPDPHR